MLEEFIQIGRAVGDALENYVETVDPIKQNKQLYVLKFNFKGDGLEVNVAEEMTESSAYKYLYVGTANGPNSPQWFVTAKGINYFLTETIFNLKEIDFGEELNSRISEVFDNFYVDLGESVKSSKYRYVLDINKHLNTERDVKEIYQELKVDNKEDKDIIKELSKDFEKYLKNKYDIKLNEIGIFTILIDGAPIKDNLNYQNKVLEYKQANKESKSSNSNNIEPICSGCGSTENVTSEINIKIKYYTTNQLIFASNIDSKNYYKNMQLCKKCKNSLLSGEVYVKNNLDTKLGDFRVYLLPHFIYGEPLNKTELDRAVNKIISSFNAAKNLMSIENLEHHIINSLDLRERNSYFLLNFMFYKPSNQATKIQRLVKDVSPSIFSIIGEASYKANLVMREALNYTEYRNYIDLQNIYYMIPVKIKSGDPTEYRDLLDIYDAVLSGRRLNKKHLITKFVDGVNVIRLKKDNYNIKAYKDLNLEFHMLKANMTIKFFEYCGNIKEGKGMDTSTLRLKEDLKQYIEKMSYDEQKSALFVLGYLIGEVGNAQYKRLDGNKPILNKLNFNGIDTSKLLRLTNDVYAKLNQEKIRNFNEVTYNELLKLLNSNLNSWKLNKDENLFYILSGYSYATTKPLFKEEK